VVIQTLKMMGIAKFRDFNTDEARKWFPISLLLIGMIYTGSKALQYLSIPVYTIFKNLAIILIAYGEVLWFGGSVTPMTLLSFGLMVFSSVIAAWADIQHALSTKPGDATSGEASEAIATLNAGYIWMLLNCFCAAAYVLGMRKRIKLTNFKDFDSTPMSAFSTFSISLIRSQPCFTITSSQSPSSSSAPSSSRTGLPRTSPLTSLPVASSKSLPSW